MAIHFRELTATQRRIVYAMPSYGRAVRSIADDPPHPEPTQPAPEHTATAWEHKAFLDSLCGVNDPIYDLDPDGIMWSEV